MVKIRVGDDLAHSEVRAKIRLDYKGVGKPGRFIFGGKTTDRMAEDLRDQQAAFYRNVPLQGVVIEEIETNTEVYIVNEDVNNREIAYAPMMMTMRVDSLEDLLQFICKEEFRKIEVLEPAEMVMNKFDVEKMLFSMSRELEKYRDYLDKKINSR